MKNPKLLLLQLFFLIILSSCDNTEPRVELSGNKVMLHNFEYVIGISGPQGVTTNADKFDKLVWNKFKNQSGQYPVVRYYNKKDQYGNTEMQEIPMGTMDLTELNKYQSLSDFQRSGGIFKIIRDN